MHDTEAFYLFEVDCIHLPSSDPAGPRLEWLQACSNKCRRTFFGPSPHEVFSLPTSGALLECPECGARQAINGEACRLHGELYCWGKWALSRVLTIETRTWSSRYVVRNRRWWHLPRPAGAVEALLTHRGIRSAYTAPNAAHDLDPSLPRSARRYPFTGGRSRVRPIASGGADHGRLRRSLSPIHAGGLGSN